MEHGPTTDFFRPRGPEFASEGVGYEEDCRAEAGYLFGDAVLGGNAADAVGVEGAIAVSDAVSEGIELGTCVLKFMLTCTKKIMVRIVHFFMLENP